MDTRIPPDDEHAPIAPEPPAGESAKEQHTRELSRSVEALEDTIETEVVHGLRKAMPVILGVFVSCLGLYLLGTRLRRRARRRRAARSM